MTTTTIENIGIALAAAAPLRRYELADGAAHLGVVWTHRGDKEWAAVVVRDKSERSGLRRRFLDRGARGWYVLSGVEVGDVLEVAADTIDRRDRRTERRAYRQVLAVTTDAVCARIVAGKDVSAGRVPPVTAEETVAARGELETSVAGESNSLSSEETALVAALRALPADRRAAVLAALEQP